MREVGEGEVERERERGGKVFACRGGDGQVDRASSHKETGIYSTWNRVMEEEAETDIERGT